MTPKPLLLLISQDPSHPLASHALRFAISVLKIRQERTEQDNQLDIFFYADGANTSNSFRWQPADQINISKQWSQLAKEHNLDLAVCVSTALARGVTDENNAKRHDLGVSNNPNNYTSNIAEGFRLVGLSELVIKMDSHKIIQF